MVTATPSAVTVVEGQMAVLNCTVTGDPTPIMSWYRNGTEVPNPSTPRYQVASGGLLVISGSVKEEDDGQFDCVASNAAGSDMDTVILTVFSELRS